MHRTIAHISDEIPPTQRQIFRRPSYIYTSHRKVAQLWEQINCDHPTLTLISSISRPTPTMIEIHCVQRSYQWAVHRRHCACATTEDTPQLRNVRRRPPRRPTPVIGAWPWARGQIDYATHFNCSAALITLNDITIKYSFWFNYRHF